MPCWAQKNFGGMADGESDTFKRVLIEGNPYFLALTFSYNIDKIEPWYKHCMST